MKGYRETRRTEKVIKNIQSKDDPNSKIIKKSSKSQRIYNSDIEKISMLGSKSKMVQSNEINDDESEI